MNKLEIESEPGEIYSKTKQILLFDSGHLHQLHPLTHEMKILKDFDEQLEAVSSKIIKELPYITDFVETEEWSQLSSSAKLALEKLNEI